MKQKIIQSLRFLAISVAGLLLAAFTFITPATVLAQQSGLPTLPCPPGLVCNLPGGTTGTSSINSLISTIITWLISVAFGLTVLFLVIGGFRYMISAGNEESAAKARATIINSLIGLVIVLLSYVVVYYVSNLLTGSSATTAP